MPNLLNAVETLLTAQRESGKPLSIILAGHNGSGKSTMWYRRLAEVVQIPLINADRLMMAILPEVAPGKRLEPWAARIRDSDQSWMQVAQRGVQAFVAQAMLSGVPFAMETVFSHWKPREDGTVESKIDLIRDLQAAGYFVILMFVGLSSHQLSIGRVQTRVTEGGHAVEIEKLVQRFPRTQQAISHAIRVADAAILTDNSRGTNLAFSVCQIRLGEQCVFDTRDRRRAPSEISAWLNFVDPIGTAQS